MIISEKNFDVNGMIYKIRSAKVEDAGKLSQVRLQIDGETEFLDREKGEAFIDDTGFEKIIVKDSESSRNLFLVAEVAGRIVGFSRCEGSELTRLSHKVEFGIGVLKEFWGYGVGKSLLQESVLWADENGIRKISLQVLEINEKAIRLYERHGFETEGLLKNDKMLSDGNFYHTVLMGRFRS